MFEIVKAGGPIMGPIILASIVAAAIILERLWTLQTKRVLPSELTDKVWRWVEQGQIQDKHIAALEQTSIAPSVMRAAADLSVGFIAPVADGSSVDLAGRQDQVMATIRVSVEAQSRALSDAAAEILAQPDVPERRFVPLTSAEAVLRYASDFIPSWAGAISIDLLPAVLVGIMAVVHASMRRGEEGLQEAERMTAADLLRSLDLSEALAARRTSVTRARSISLLRAPVWAANATIG